MDRAGEAAFAADTIEVGGRFKNWNIEHVVGRGGMGTVYRARHVLVGREAAIKVVRPPRGMRADDTAIARFRVETELHVALRHPNLPEFFDAELMPDGTAVLVLEFLDGFDLSAALHKVGSLSVGDALFVATEVLRALVVMHATSVHRDVKPSNIFLCRAPRFDSEGRLEKGRVRLLDFGIAKLKGRKGPTKESNTIGTTSYMSPEQLMGHELDGRSDLYALGAVLHEALVGHPVFVAVDDEPPPPATLVYQHVHAKAPDVRDEVPSVPEDVALFVARLLEKAPRDRFARTEDALDAARALRQRHRASARLFREDVADVVEAVEALSVERQRFVPEPPRLPPARPDDVTVDAPPSPRRVGRVTDRITPPVAPVRWIETLHRAIRGPRCFERPALVVFERDAPRTYPVVGDAMSIAGVVVERRPEGRVFVRPVTAVGAGMHAFAVDGAPAPSGAQVALGTRLLVGGLQATVTDLAVWDPRGGAPPAPRWYPARVEVRAGGRPAFVTLDKPLTLVGSAPVCDLAIAGLDDVAAAFWMRGDGAFELQMLDVRALPMGDPVARVSILRASTRIDVGAVTLAFIEGAAPPPSAEVVAPPSYLGAVQRRDRLVVTGERAAGRTGSIPDTLVLPQRTTVIGSGAGADIVLTHQHLDPRHVELKFLAERADARYRVRDLGSKGGTFVNRRRVKESDLKAGDYLDLGGAITVQLVVGEPPPPDVPSAEGAPESQRLRARLLERLGLGAR